jgi:hypothetical protein
MEVQIGKYKRPGIFIEEFDNSVIQAPIVQGLSTMVMGFSRKGPVNRPVLLESQDDLSAIFGPLDRFLEKRGSYFHRTISKMLESSPVLAFNILETDDALDTLEYKSFSTSTAYTNDVKRTGPYRRFFDTTGFWTRDREAFLNLVEDNPNDANRIFHITNMSDKNITVFTFKSTRTGFDQSLIDWYGAVEKVPTYLYPQDYASDYMLDVVVVAGNWTNYQELAVDSRWSQYFNTSGLRKDQVVNFINDINVTSLAYYNGVSLIPYFRDANGRNIFIENVINAETDKTGLFCAFDIDALETEYPNGLIDIVGNNLMSNDISDIEYLSYKDTITETISFTNKELDTAGNVISFGDLYKSGTPSSPGLNRSAFMAEGYVYGVTTTFVDGTLPPSPVPSPAPAASLSNTSITVDFVVASGAYAVIGGEKIDLVADTYSFTINASDYVDLDDGTTVTNGTSFFSVFTLDTTGTINKLDNITNSDRLNVSATDIVLAYLDFDVLNDGGTNYIINEDITYVTVDTTGFIELAEGTDFTVTADGSGNLTYEFLNTDAVPDTSEYEQYRRIKFFNYAINYLEGPNFDEMTMLIDGNIKASLASMTVSNIVTSNTLNKAFTLETGLDETDLTDLLNTGSPASGFNLCIYITDDEFILSEESLVTKNTYATSAEGVVARYSDFYSKYVDGQINTGDYFHENLIDTTWDISFEDNAGDDFVVFYNATESISFNTNDKIVIPEATSNTGVFTILDPNNKAGDLGYGAGYFAFLVNENTTAEVVNDATKVLDFNNKHYLKMYVSSNVLTVEFTDSTLGTSNPILDLASNQIIDVFSQKTNFKQTVEIEMPSGYVREPNKILVDAARYTEVKIGDYLEADYDASELEIGEVPRMITRILSKRLWSGDTSLVEISCDAAIKVTNFDGDLQTQRITNVDDYVNVYKGITLTGFRVREASMPDGTEERQQEILANIGKGTNLYKALTSKEVVTFRYLIDGFGLGLTSQSKQELMDIVGERLDAFAFLNMPSMKDFKNSTNPTFVDDEGVLQTSFIAQGGDPESSPAFLYSFGEGKGVSAAGYFAPYCVVNDNGRPITVPPAMFVASTYMRKLNANQTNIQPWTIAAGITNGQITGIAGLETLFNNEDIENLNGMKANPLVRKRNRGFVIETENTAQTLVTSALSFIHVREVLIELENELADMLLEFQWKFNTPEVRAEIKLRADIICASFVNRNGLFNYFNKIDEENNTAEIIDNQIGVLDTYVEPIKGMGVIVNNITILRTNAIQSGGFI